MDRLIQGAKGLGFEISDSQRGLFQTYYELLVEWNQRFNLTAITDYEQVQIRHFLDSLSCLLPEEYHTALRRPAPRVIDVGSGAGFPGTPLKIVCPNMHLTLLEATGKKVAFLSHLIAALDLKNVQVIKGRAEELAHDPAHREQYDLAMARAVAGLPVVVEYTLPFCRTGGCLVAQKGESGAAEAWNAERAIHLLGGELQRIQPVELSGLPEDRTLVVITKVSPTPIKYPRRTGVPSKRPL